MVELARDLEEEHFMQVKTLTTSPFPAVQWEKICIYEELLLCSQRESCKEHTPLLTQKYGRLSNSISALTSGGCAGEVAGSSAGPGSEVLLEESRSGSLPSLPLSPGASLDFASIPADFTGPLL